MFNKGDVIYMEPTRFGAGRSGLKLPGLVKSVKAAKDAGLGIEAWGKDDFMNDDIWTIDLF